MIREITTFLLFLFFSQYPLASLGCYDARTVLFQRDTASNDGVEQSRVEIISL